MDRMTYNSRIAFAPEDGGGAAPVEAGADGAAADAAAAAAVAPPADPATPPAGAAAEGAKPGWWEDKRFDDDDRRTLTAHGLTVDDPIDAAVRLVKMERAAKQKLGHKPDELLVRPGKDEKVPEWMRKNAALFGIPESPDKYEVTRPETWPKEAEWDAELETEARKIGHEEGLSGSALNRMVGLYASQVQKLVGNAAADAAAARTEMMGELQRDWGAQTEARMGQARQAAAAVAEAAGLDGDALAALTADLSAKAGNAATMRLFAAMGEMMASDKAVGLGSGGALGMSPAEARAEIASIDAAGTGARAVAYAKGDSKALKELNARVAQLNKIAAGG